MDNRQKQVPLALMLGVAFTWLGTHAGGGFASGSQTMSFVTRWGTYGMWTYIVTFIVIAVVYRILLIMARDRKLYNFKSLMDEMYKPYDKVGSTIYEIIYMVANLMAISSCVAGGGTVLVNLFGINYYLGIVLIGVVILALSIFGAGLIRKASTVLTILILVGVVIISYYGYTSGGFHLTEYLSSEASHVTSIWNALYRALCYSGFQMWCFAGILGVSTGLKTNKSINVAITVGFILNIVALALTCILMTGYMPEAQAETLPLYYICESTGQRIALVAYTTVLFCAYLSTAITVIFGMCVRYTELFTRNKPNANKTVVNALLGLVFIVACVIVSTAGLTRIINIGFQYCGLIGLLVVAIPVLIAGTIKNKKFAQAHPNIEEERLNEE